MTTPDDQPQSTGEAKEAASRPGIKTLIIAVLVVMAALVVAHRSEVKAFLHISELGTFFHVT